MNKKFIFVNFYLMIFTKFCLCYPKILFARQEEKL